MPSVGVVPCADPGSRSTRVGARHDRSEEGAAPAYPCLIQRDWPQQATVWTFPTVSNYAETYLQC